MNTIKPPAILVDIDGTLARNTHRGPFEYERLLFDEPIRPVIELAELLWDEWRHHVVIMSGREDKDAVRQDTRDWLTVHTDLPTDRLLMRAAGDYRPDELVKRELYEQHVAPHYDVRYVIDDRAKVVKMWRSLGLTVLDVAGNDF